MPQSSRVVFTSRARVSKPATRRSVLWFLTILGSIGLVAGLWYAARLSVFAVTDIEVVGAGSAEEMRRSVEAMITGRTIFAIPANNFFAVSSGRIRRELERQFPSAAAVDVQKRFPHRLVIRVAERVLWGVYCQRQQGGAARTCAYLDQEGTAYEELSGFEGWLLPVLFGPFPIQLGESPVPTSALLFFERAKAELTPLGAELLSAAFSTTTPDDARLSLAEGWELWVTVSRPSAEWREILETVLARDIGERRGELEYVDLRFGRKVFYKFR